MPDIEKSALLKKNDGAGNTYVVHPYTKAENVDYDNTNSGLTSNNVKTAIDELSDRTPPAVSEAHKQLVTDGEGNAKWEDRTHWVEKTEVELIPEQTLTDGVSEHGVYVFSVSDFPIVLNLEYTAVFDGVEYKCRSAELERAPYIGNLTILGAPAEDTGEPFIIFSQDGVSVAATTAGPHTISLTGPKFEYHQLPLDYIPNGFALSGMIYHDSNTMTFDEAGAYRRAMSEAFHPILKWRTNEHGGYCFLDGISTGSDAEEEYVVIYPLGGGMIRILKNSDGVYDLKGSSYAELSLGVLEHVGVDLETQKRVQSNANLFFKSLEPITISPNVRYSSNATVTPLFKVEKNGSTKGQNFEVLGNGTVKAYSVILPSSTEGSIKQFKITVDDSGTISATEV